MKGHNPILMWFLFLFLFFVWAFYVRQSIYKTGLLSQNWIVTKILEFFFEEMDDRMMCAKNNVHTSDSLAYTWKAKDDFNILFDRKKSKANSTHTHTHKHAPKRTGNHSLNLWLDLRTKFRLQIKWNVFLRPKITLFNFR